MPKTKVSGKEIKREKKLTLETTEQNSLLTHHPRKTLKRNTTTKMSHSKSDPSTTLWATTRNPYD